MKSPLENIVDLGDIIRQLQKIDSKLEAGQFLAAHRDTCRLIAFFETARAEIINEAKAAENAPSQPLTPPPPPPPPPTRIIKEGVG